MNRNDYISYIIHNGINLQNYQVVEIIGSIINKNFIIELEKALYDSGAKEVYINYNDDEVMNEKINNGYSLYINQDIDKYIKLIEKKFTRIIVKTEFVNFNHYSEMKISEYKKSMRMLKFVEDYFVDLCSQKTICCAANKYWAARLNMTEESLWQKIYYLVSYKSDALAQIEKLNSLNLTDIEIKTDLGTKLKARLTDDFVFATSRLITKDGIEFTQNIPSLEIFTSPNRYLVDGKIVSSKPLKYKGKIIDNIKLTIRNGKIINLSDYNFDSNYEYIGEIGILETITEDFYYSKLLDENTATHIGLGKSYPYGIKQLDKINNSLSHLDIVIGDSSIEVYGYNKKEKYIIIEKGKLKIEKIYG